MRPLLGITTLSLLTLFATTSISTAQVSPDRVLVRVNGEAITGDRYFRRMEVLPHVGRMRDGRFVENAPGFLTLQQLITETLLLQVARNNNVYPTDAQVTEELQRRLAYAPDLLRGFELLGLDESFLRHEIRISLAEFNLQTMGVTVTDFEVEKYYQDNPGLFVAPKRYHLRMIGVSTAAMKQTVDGELAAGTSFADVARRHSEEASKIAGGDMGVVEERSLADVMRPVVAATAKGETSAWVEAQGYHFKFQVLDIFPEEKLELDAELKAEIRKSLMVAQGRQRNNLSAMVEEAKGKANIEYVDTPFEQQLRGVFRSGS